MLYLAIETEVATAMVANLVLGYKIRAIKMLRDSKTTLVDSDYEGETARMPYRPGLGEAKYIVDRMQDNLSNIPLCSGIDFRILEARFRVDLAPPRR